MAAIGAFRDKYIAIPGDMQNATRFWSRQVASANCATNSAASVTTPGACDGNGNGRIEYLAPDTASNPNEVMQSWRQLAAAGLIEGSYTGMAGTGSRSHHVVGENAPQNKISNATWELRYLGIVSSQADLYDSDYASLLAFGNITSTTGPIAAALKPEEAWNIDTKLDDGRPATGKILARYWNNLCSSPDSGALASNNLNASYRLSDTSTQCALFFRQIF